MKKTILTVVMAVLSVAVFSQSEKYIKAMEPKVAMLDSNNSAESWKELANAFERIADAEKTQWLPYYYASYATVMAGTMLMPQDGSFGDNSALLDPYADKAEKLLNTAMELEKNNSELYCVKKMIHTLRLMGNAMARYMTEGAMASEALGKAKSLNENNPRVYLLEGQDKYYTPEQFGGSKEEAKTLFEKAQSIFMTSKPGSSIEPQWGKSQVMYFLSQYK
jgi:hypothetical protein